MRIIFIVFFSLSFAFAKETEYDIFERIINFVVFASVLFYFIKKPIKEFFSNRTTLISNRLQKAEDKLIKSKKEKELSKSKIEDAKKIAQNFTLNSKKENDIISAKIAKKTELELKNLEKQYKELMVFYRKSIINDIVKEVLKDALDEENFNISNEQVSDLLLKRIA